MADLPECRVNATNKPFKFCGVDYLGPFTFLQNRSDCKAWGQLFTCLCTSWLLVSGLDLNNFFLAFFFDLNNVHVELVTGLDLNNFFLAFSRFVNLRGAVDTMYSDNGSTFHAAASVLPSLLSSTEFHNSLHKRNISWANIPPYAPSQGGAWEIMVKLFKASLTRVMNKICRKPSLIELQTFMSDAVRIVNDRPLTTVSDKPNDLALLCPSSFLGQQLAPYTPVGTFHNQGDLRQDYLYNATLAQRFWESWSKGYLPTLQKRGKWRISRENLLPSQLVLVGDADDFAKRGSFRLGRIYCVHPQFRHGKEYVRRATVAVLKRDGLRDVEHIFRNVFKITPL